MPLALQKMSNLDYFYVTEELQVLVGGYLNKVFEIRPNVFRFKVRADKEYNLIVELGLRANLSKYIEESPDVPTNYTMLLRKHLENAKITEVKQENDDRLLILTLQKGDEYHLIFEMFAKGNLIFTTADYTILQPYKSDISEKRAIKKMETYIALPNPNRLASKPPKSPSIYYDDARIAGFSSVTNPKFDAFRKKEFPTVCEAVDEYYYAISQQMEDEKGGIVAQEPKSIKRLEHTLEQQQAAIKKFDEEIVAYQKSGEYVYKNFQYIDELLKAALEMKKQKLPDEDIQKKLLDDFNLKLSYSKGKISLET